MFFEHERKALWTRFGLRAGTRHQISNAHGWMPAFRMLRNRGGEYASSAALQ